MRVLGWKIKGQPLPLKLICSHCRIRFGLTYQVRRMTLASTVFKKSTFHKKPNLNALGSIFDLEVK